MLQQIRSPRLRSKRILLAFSAAFIILLLFALDSRLLVRRYSIDEQEISAPIRLALITDLHSCRYGEGQSTLIEAVRAQNPDLVLLVGDIFDDVRSDENTELFLAGIADDFPCYYVTGNHEYWSGAEAFVSKMSILQKYGVTILSAAYETIEINGEKINICGVDDPDVYRLSTAFPTERQIFALGAATRNGAYTILLSHRPEFFELYRICDFDLILCGHAHGGQWRIPGLMNGLFAPAQGLFPKYAGGKYTEDNTTMIVSRGLARESTRIPRIFNRPELVIVEIH